MNYKSWDLNTGGDWRWKNLPVGNPSFSEGPMILRVGYLDRGISTNLDVKLTVFETWDVMFLDQHNPEIIVETIDVYNWDVP